MYNRYLTLTLIVSVSLMFPLSFHIDEKNPICFLETFTMGQVELLESHIFIYHRKTPRVHEGKIKTIDKFPVG